MIERIVELLEKKKEESYYKSVDGDMYFSGYNAAISFAIDTIKEESKNDGLIDEMTYGDKIRKMNDEEIAKEIMKWHSKLFDTDYRCEDDITERLKESDRNEL